MTNTTVALSLLSDYIGRRPEDPEIDAASVVTAMALVRPPGSIAEPHSLVEGAGSRLIEEGHADLLAAAGYDPAAFGPDGPGEGA